MSGAAFLYYLLPDLITNTSLLDECRFILAPEERQRVDLLALQRHRNERLLARATLRKALSDLTGLSPSTWQFRKNAHGRPEIEAPSDHRHLKFSVSHADGLIACLLSWHREVGLDVEPIQQVDGMLDIADRYFARCETVSLRALPGHEQGRRFLELWTLKESYLKARGLGLSIPLTEVAFTIKKNAVYARFGAQLADDPVRWQFNLERLNDYLIATTVERRCRLGVKIAMRNAVRLMNCP
jgi:4'-phosphopantetheinyl transferase